MNAAWDVLGFGAVAVDDLIYLDSYPVPDSKTLIQDRRREGGGLAGTALVAAARLGARAAYAGVLGDDELSRFSIEELEREGVDCTLVQRQPAARPYHSTIIVDRSTGQRTILVSAIGVTPPASGSYPGEVIAACRVLFVDSTVATFALEAMTLAQARGIPVVADLERASGDEIPVLARQVDHLIVGADFAGQMTGEGEPAAMARALRSPAHTACVVTAGGRGCWYIARATGEEVHHVPAYPVHAVDTTGCGDVFHGAYAACIARGESVAQAIAVATVTAGLKAARPGGRSGIPDLKTVAQHLPQHDGRRSPKTS